MTNGFVALDPFTKAISTCPDGCDPPLIVKAVPKAGLGKNAFCRCLHCLTFWEVTAIGQVENIKWGIDSIHQQEAIDQHTRSVWRSMRPEIRDKIAATLKGRTLSAEHRQAISKGLKQHKFLQKNQEAMEKALAQLRQEAEKDEGSKTGKA